jgi:hypothetical protein
MGETIKIKNTSEVLVDIIKRLTLVEARSLYRKTPLKVPKLTTTERDALDAEAGDFIYNTTTNKHQGYNGSTWNDCY